MSINHLPRLPFPLVLSASGRYDKRAVLIPRVYSSWKHGLLGFQDGVSPEVGAGFVTVIVGRLWLRGCEGLVAGRGWVTVFRILRVPGQEGH